MPLFSKICALFVFTLPMVGSGYETMLPPRRRVSFNSRNEGVRNAVDDVAEGFAVATA